MNIFIQHQGQQIGPFTLDQVSAGIASGIYQLSDMAWYEGAAGWAPLSTVPGIGGGNPSVVPRTSALAITSLVLGILSFFTVGLTSLPAVICGHVARWKIKRSEGVSTGRGLALAGLICGYFGFIFVIAFVGAVAAPMVIRQRQKADQTEAVNNARQMGLALVEFETEYGKFPDDETATEVADSTETKKVTGKSSNACFRQLIRAGIASTETMFYAKTPGTRKPDGVIDGDNAIAKGECGFAYVSHPLTTAGRPRPLAMAPFVPGTDQFDPKPYSGKAVILWTDGSVTSMNIKLGTGEVMKEGKNLLDPSHPVWSGTPPVIFLPE
ncbi:MAG: DUF4190 domain-containing protein [Verrucomicrobiaceae bacterium]|nr:MAG: DUF4190 domain-containing protein [Verrucomicrobiaceae bacterium]